MHTASSASRTYLASRSASEYTTTDFTPSSRQARWMRSAISPRFAIRIFLNMPLAALFDDEQGLPEFHGLAVLAEDAGDRAGLVGLDLVHDLHRLDDADRLAFLDDLAHVGERLGARAGGAVEG